MAKQDYVIKKYVKAESAETALMLDRVTDVAEVFLVENKPIEAKTDAVGFKFVECED